MYIDTFCIYDAFCGQKRQEKTPQAYSMMLTGSNGTIPELPRGYADNNPGFWYIFVPMFSCPLHGVTTVAIWVQVPREYSSATALWQLHSAEKPVAASHASKLQGSSRGICSPLRAYVAFFKRRSSKVLSPFAIIAASPAKLPRELKYFRAETALFTSAIRLSIVYTWSTVGRVVWS